MGVLASTQCLCTLCPKQKVIVYSWVLTPQGDPCAGSGGGQGSKWQVVSYPRLLYTQLLQLWPLPLSPDLLLFWSSSFKFESSLSSRSSPSRCLLEWHFWAPSSHHPKEVPLAIDRLNECMPVPKNPHSPGLPEKSKASHVPSPFCLFSSPSPSHPCGRVQAVLLPRARG